MAQYDVHQDKVKLQRRYIDVQSNVLADLSVRMVIPLMPQSPLVLPIARLNPVIEIEGKPLMLMTQLMAPIPTKALGPVIANLDDQSDVIANSLDMLFKGF